MEGICKLLLAVGAVQAILMLLWVGFRLTWAKITWHVVPLGGVTQEHRNWCHKNCRWWAWAQPGPTDQRYYQLWFLHKRDAMLFLLSFDGHSVPRLAWPDWGVEQ